MKSFWLCLLLSSSLLRATGLLWEKTEAKIEVAPLAESADTEFRFKNAGSRTITIRKVSVGCDCISAQTDKTTYAPGETGVLRARFFYDGLPADYTREIAVETDEADSPPVLLVMRVSGPGLGRAAVREVEWSLPASEEKFVDLIPNPNLPVTFSELGSSSNKFAVRLLPGDGTVPTRIGIRPLNITQRTVSVVHVIARDPGGRKITLHVNAWAR